MECFAFLHDFFGNFLGFSVVHQPEQMENVGPQTLKPNLTQKFVVLFDETFLELTWYQQFLILVQTTVMNVDYRGPWDISIGL